VVPAYYAKYVSAELAMFIYRWREEQIKMRAEHVASSLRVRPASVDVLARQITQQHGKEGVFYGGTK